MKELGRNFLMGKSIKEKQVELCINFKLTKCLEVSYFKLSVAFKEIII